MMGWVRSKVFKWRRDTSGAVAVEFALIAMPFIYILLGIIEISLMFGAMSTLDFATNDAARLIRTGQIQTTAGDPEQMFKDAICEKTSTFLRCSDISYEVIRMDSFSDFSSYPATYDENGDLQSAGFDPGAVDDVILIRTAYKYPMMTPLIGSLISDTAGNAKLITSTVVLETEPYDIDLAAQ